MPDTEHAVPYLRRMLSVLASAEPQSFGISGSHLIMGLIAGVVTAICVGWHYEVLSTAARFLPRLKLRPRARIVFLILAILVAHVIEIWIFGLTYWLLDRWPELGTIEGPMQREVLDFVYYSGVTYTTVGFGDLLPHGAVRVLTGTEALVGLVLITWSASLAFLQMQRDWREYQD